MLINFKIFLLILSCVVVDVLLILNSFCLIMGNVGTLFDRFWRFLFDLLFWFIIVCFLISLRLIKYIRTYIIREAALRPCVNMGFVYCSSSQIMLDSGSSTPNTWIPM